MIPSIVVCISAVVCLLVAEWAGSRIAKIAAKMSAATAFLAMALACGALESTYGQILLGGLVLCWIGDACLLSPGQSTGFLAGIGAFLLGHLVYAIAFYQLGFDWTGLLVGGLVIGGLATITLRWLHPQVPDDFRIAVISYIGVISVMVIASIGAVAAGAPIILAIGAIVFGISDVFVARERFVSSGFINSGLGLPAYFGAQLLLAYTARFGVGS
jgi:uncharacterized membrane protein YhhN